MTCRSVSRFRVQKAVPLPAGLGLPPAIAQVKCQAADLRAAACQLIEVQCPILVPP